MLFYRFRATLDVVCGSVLFTCIGCSFSEMSTFLQAGRPTFELKADQFRLFFVIPVNS